MAWGTKINKILFLAQGFIVELLHGHVNRLKFCVKSAVMESLGFRMQQGNRKVLMEETIELQFKESKNKKGFFRQAGEGRTC